MTGNALAHNVKFIGILSPTSALLSLEERTNLVLEGLPDPLEELMHLRSVAEQRLDAAIDHGDVEQIQDWVVRIADLDKSLRQYGIEIDA